MKNNTLILTFDFCVLNLSGERQRDAIGRGVFVSERSPAVRRDGRWRSKNVGISNKKTDEKSVHRKSKVSQAMIISLGLVGPKPKPKGVGNGQLVNIPAPSLVLNRGTRRNKRSVFQLYISFILKKIKGRVRITKPNFADFCRQEKPGVLSN